MHTLGLKPGKTGRLPAAGGAAVPILVERSFETPSDIVTGPIAHLGHRLSCSQAPASRTANEEEVVVGLSAKRLELAGETLNKPRIHSLVRKSLPLDEDSSFADGSEIGNAHIGPFRARAHVDQLRARTRGKTLPSRLNVDVVYRSLTVLHGQMTIAPWLRCLRGVCQHPAKLKDPLGLFQRYRRKAFVIGLSPPEYSRKAGERWS